MKKTVEQIKKEVQGNWGVVYVRSNIAHPISLVQLCKCGLQDRVDDLQLSVLTRGTTRCVENCMIVPD